MSVDLLEEVQLLRRRQPVSVHQQGDDVSQIETLEAGVFVDPDRAGLLGRFDERLDGRKAFCLAFPNDTVVQGAVVVVRKGCDLPAVNFRRDVNVLSGDDSPDDLLAGFVVRSFGRTCDDVSISVERPRLGRRRRHAGRGDMAVGNVST